MRAHQFDLSLPEPTPTLIHRTSSINIRSENQNSVRSRIQSKIRSIPKVQKINASFPNIQITAQLPNFDKFVQTQQKQISITPMPPIIRTGSDLYMYKAIKKFASKYQYIWIMIVENDHPAIKNFQQIYQAQRISNVNQHLENLLVPNDYANIDYFTKQGLTVKIMADYFTFKNFLKPQITKYIDNTKIMDIFIEKKGDKGALPSKKVHNVQDLVTFIQQQVKLDVQNARKDKPYFNFLQSNSGPDLYNRRTILKNCLTNKSQQQLATNNTSFFEMLRKYNKDQKDLKFTNILKRQASNATKRQKQLDEINARWSNWQLKITKCEMGLQKIVNNYYPLQSQNEQLKKSLYSLIIAQYCAQSPLYSAVNNTIRFSTSMESVRPISTFVKYLFDAIRYFFTTQHRMINYDAVYRGSRISLVEQRGFITGRYIRNLGFMSTSRNPDVARRFISGNDAEQQQQILIIIQLSKLTKNPVYLSDQQGFFSVDKILDVRQFQQISKHQQQVLFNPLNVYQITDWNRQKRVLRLKYAPHLQILQKKRRMKYDEALTDEQMGLLQSIQKFKNQNFDKGQHLLEQGDPNSAIKYYQQSQETGSNLSFNQKSNYFRGLVQVGEIKKMQKLLQASLQQQKNAEKQAQSNKTIGSSALQKLADSVQSIELLRQTNDLATANQKLQKISQQSIKASIETPSKQAFLLEIKSCIEKAKVKHQLSQTLESIQQSIKSLMYIDNFAEFDFTFRHWSYINELKQVKKLKIDENKILLKQIQNMPEFNISEMEAKKSQVLQKMMSVRYWRVSMMNLKVSPSNESNPLLKSDKQQNSKEQHKLAQKCLRQYFTIRDKRNQLQLLEQKFVYSYWELSSSTIDWNPYFNDRQMQEYIEEKEKLKKCQDHFYQVKNQYSQLFQYQLNAYEVLYRNIYKTSIDVSTCLESYCNNFCQRYVKFANLSLKNDGPSINIAQAYRKHGEMLNEQTAIIRKLDQKDIKQKVKLADEQIKKAEQVIKKIQDLDRKYSENSKNSVVFTNEKKQISEIKARNIKSKILDKQKMKKTSLQSKDSIDSASTVADSTVSTTNTEKAKQFSKLVNIIDQIKQIYHADPNLNKPIFIVKNACQKIQVMNESSSIQIKGVSYVDRLKSCQKQFNDAMSTIKQYDEIQLMQRNLKMAHLYYLMADNQFRLGIIVKSREYLQQSYLCTKKALKIDQEQFKNKNVSKDKLLLGNSTHIGCLKLEAQLVSYFGSHQQRKKMYASLVQQKKIMFQTMNQPLSQADISESIGIVASSLIIYHRQLSFNQVKKPFLQAISMRQKLLGKYNKLNARNYALIVKMISEKDIRLKHLSEITRYHDSAVVIYDRVDLSQSTLILYRMQLRSTYYIFTDKNNQAINVIQADLEKFQNCKNKQITLQTAKQLFRCSSFLADQSKSQQEGLNWLKFTYKFINSLEELVNQIEKADDKGDRKRLLIQLKVDVLRKIVKTTLLITGDAKGKYRKLYEIQKENLAKFKKFQK